MSLNARSIVNKVDLFKATVFDLQPNIIGVTESWVTDKIFDSELHLDNYRTFRCDRQTGNRGGGVLLYIKDDLNPMEFHIDTEYDEQVWCYIGDLLVGICYRSSNLEIVGQDNETKLMKILHEVCNKHVLIMGDFNYPVIDWSTYTVNPPSSSGSDEFVQAIEDCFYTQHVLYPTRGSAILDLILSTDPDLVSNVQIISSLGNSDHNMITFTVHYEHVVSTNVRIVRDYHRGNYERIKAELQKIDWDHEFASDLDTSWNKFKHILLHLESKYVRYRSKNLKILVV